MNVPTFCRLVFVLTGIFVAAGSVRAGRVEPFAATPQETAMCNALVWGGKDKLTRLKLEGEEKWAHTHHYCDCIRFRYRALSHMGDRPALKFNLDIAIGGCDYVLNRVPQNHFLRAKIHVDKGRALKLKGESAAAFNEFSSAMQVDPHEIYAYVEKSELERSNGRQKDAMETVTLGLRHNPGSKVLQRSYLDLGGKEPFPEPFQQSEDAAAAAKPADEGGAQSQPADTVSAGQVEQAAPGEQAGMDAQTVVTPPPAEVPDRGCRFCPPPEIIQRWNKSFSPPDGPAGAAVDKAH